MKHQHLFDMPENPDAAMLAILREMLHLVKEIHTCITVEHVTNKKKTALKPKKPTIKDAIRDLMSDGFKRGCYQVWEALALRGIETTENTISGTLASLRHKGDLIRIRHNLYQIAPVKKEE